MGHRLLCLLLLLLLSIVQSFGQVDKFAIIPTQGQLGAGNQGINIQKRDCSTAGGMKNWSVESLNPNITISSPELSTDGCDFFAKITIASSAQTGISQFVLRDPTKAIVGKVDFNVMSQLPAPIPEGLSPQVDVIWGVANSESVSHNFGNTVKSAYIALGLLIGNNSGYDIEITAVGFKLPGQSEAVPTSSLSLIRGDLEWSDKFSSRNQLYRYIQFASLFTEGLIPFFHRPSAKANYSTGAALFSGPLEKGFNAAFPDVTIDQLAHLESYHVLKEGTIIPNNTHVLLIAFIDKSIVSKCSGSKKNTTELPGWNCVSNFDKPMEVRSVLGELVLVGRPIFYLNTVKIKSAAISTTVPLPVATPSKITANIATPQTITLRGPGVGKASVSSADATIQIVSQQPNGPDELAVTLNAQNIAPGDHSILLQRAGSSNLEKITISAVSRSLSANPSAVDFQDVRVNKSAQQTVTLRNTSPDPLDLTYQLDHADQGFQVTNCSTIAANQSCELAIQFKPPSKGPHSAVLTISLNPVAPQVQITLKGNGIAPGLSLSSLSLNFPDQKVGSSSSKVTLTVTNNGSDDLKISDVRNDASGNPGDFQDTNNCNAPIKSNSSCTIEVIFKPTAPGPRSAVIKITSNAQDDPVAVPLSGKGTP